MKFELTHVLSIELTHCNLGHVQNVKLTHVQYGSIWHMCDTNCDFFYDG